MGWADVGYKGSSIETPSLGRLAREGTRLERFYATPVSSPTRAALMNSREAAR
jgi:arylsulfatase B